MDKQDAKLPKLLAVLHAKAVGLWRNVAKAKHKVDEGSDAPELDALIGVGAGDGKAFASLLLFPFCDVSGVLIPTEKLISSYSSIQDTVAAVL